MTTKGTRSQIKKMAVEESDIAFRMVLISSRKAPVFSYQEGVFLVTLLECINFCGE